MLIQLAETSWLPDRIIRFGIRRLLRERITTEGRVSSSIDEFAEGLRSSAITLETERANQQHYEVPTEFFQLVLGKRLKYSCGLWPHRVTSLDASEEAMLELTRFRAGIEDGMAILDLGCGWGSLSLWVAERYPRCRILALSNSVTQRKFILDECRRRQLENLEVITSDVAKFDTQRRFDRIVSVEMFEHVRNYERLFSRIAGWLRTDGQMLVHIFCHRKYAYPFHADGGKDWMGRHFFSGGIMPSLDLFTHFDRDLSVARQWWISGTHYAQTCEAWLARLDASKDQARSILKASENPEDPGVQLQRWRMFFMACAELFAYGKGSEWGVGHYLFRPTQPKSLTTETCHYQKSC